MKILYIHGFASIGNSYKGNLLMEKFGKENVISPTFSSKPEIAIREIESIITKESSVVLAGTSLGGFYSDYFNVKYSIPAVIINPLVEPVVVEKYIGPNINFYTNEEFLFSREDFNFLHKIKMEKEGLKSYTVRRAKEVLLLAQDDDLLDYKLALKEYRFPGQEVRLFPEGGHRFTNSFEIVRAVKDISSLEELK